MVDPLVENSVEQWNIPPGEFTNNFFTFFPGGFVYQQKGMEDIDPSVARVIRAVDELALEHAVDGEDIQGKMRRANELAMKGSQRDLEESAKFRWEVHQIIYPLFQEMLRRGFSKKDIW